MTDYLLYIEDEDLKTYSTFVIDSGDVTYSYGQLTIPVSVTLTEERRYNMFLFPQDGNLSAGTGTTESWWANFLTLKAAGSISDDVLRSRIFCSNQTNVQKHSMQNGQYTPYETPTTDKVITYGG